MNAKYNIRDIEQASHVMQKFRRHCPPPATTPKFGGVFTALGEYVFVITNFIKPQANMRKHFEKLA
jgi:hypothetical protein